MHPLKSKPIKRSAKSSADLREEFPDAVAQTWGNQTVFISADLLRKINNCGNPQQAVRSLLTQPQENGVSLEDRVIQFQFPLDSSEWLTAVLKPRENSDGVLFEKSQ